MNDLIDRNTLLESDQAHFRDWIGLNLDGISWEGRYLDEFNQFWDHLFVADTPISEQFQLFLKLRENLSDGPLIRWIKWLEDKFICFLYLNKKLSIREISQLSKTKIQTVSTTLRDFLVHKFPRMEEYLNTKFQAGNLLSDNLDTKFVDIKKELGFDKPIYGYFENDVFRDLEVTLYPDWKKIVLIIKSNTKSARKKSTKKSMSLLGRKHLSFLQELVILFLIGGVLILSIKIGNKWYEEHLVKKISLFSPDFFWLDKSLSFKSKGEEEEKNLDISLDELDKLEKIESKNIFIDNSIVSRFEVESDVVLRSVDSLPKDFDIADLEQSNYEESKKGGFRNRRYGRRKAYRVMLTSVDAKSTKSKLEEILKKYEVKQVDNVKPGTEIPGGIYFNLNVTHKSLKDFLASVSSFEESMILESKTNASGPANTSKVFIWIKTI